jgi:hypothetical protein
MRSELRQFLNAAEQLGFEFVGYDGNNHLRLRNNETGDSYSTALTPSEYRSRRNALADLERISGRKLPRANAGHYRGQRRRAMMDTERSKAERQRGHEVEKLVTEAEELHQRFHQLAEVAVKDYAVITEARKVLLRYEDIRLILAESHRIIPSIESVNI